MFYLWLEAYGNFRLSAGAYGAISGSRPNQNLETHPRPGVETDFALPPQLDLHLAALMPVIRTQVMNLFDLNITLESSPVLLTRRQQREGTRAGGRRGAASAPAVVRCQIISLCPGPLLKRDLSQVKLMRLWSDQKPPDAAKAPGPWRLIYVPKTIAPSPACGPPQSSFGNKLCKDRRKARGSLPL
jgi:hypothetical protein